MIRKVAKKTRSHSKIRGFIEKFNIPHAYIGLNRRSVSRAVLVGIFIGLLPMPFQMVAVLALLPFFSFNAPIALALVWVSNPLTMPFIFYAEYVAGNYLLMRSDEAQGAATGGEITMEWFESNIEAIILPLYTGAFFFATLLSITAFLLVNRLWIRSVHVERGSRREEGGDTAESGK